MAPLSSSPEKPLISFLNRRTMAAQPPPSPRRRRPQKFRSMKDIMARAKLAVSINGDDDDEEEQEMYSDLVCEECNNGDNDDEILICDKCDKGFHMHCVRPIVARVPTGSWKCTNCAQHRVVVPKQMSQRKIYEFFKIKMSPNWSDDTAESFRDNRKRKKRFGLVIQKRKRRLVPYSPTDDNEQRLAQMRSLATALTALGIEFSDELTYRPSMAPRSANRADYENAGMQVLCKEDMETVEHCRAMCRRGECPPLMVVYDSREGYTVQADGPIRDMTFLAEYTGDVDFIKKREHDDCDSMMSLLLAEDPLKSLVICPDKRGNIARFLSGINNHTPDGKRKVNCKCVRYNVNDECRAFLIATRDIAKGERLYYDYNGYEQEYPTHHFT